MLAAELKSKGVYAIKLFGMLTDLEADENEYLLIRKIMQSKFELYNFLHSLIVEPELVGNVHGGNLTDRLNTLTLEQLDAAMNEVYAKTMQLIENTDEDQLFTEESAKVGILS
jgi:hypothetical protein